MVETEAWADMLSENFLRPVYTDSAETTILMEDFYQRYLAVLRDVGLAKQ